MSSLGRVCAIGIGCNMLLSVFLLPVWWKYFLGEKRLKTAVRKSSRAVAILQHVHLAGRIGARTLHSCAGFGFFARMLAAIYWRLAAHRREIVIQNLLPALNGDRRKPPASAGN